MTPEEIAERGRRASELQSNDILNGAFESVKAGCIEAWSKTQMHDQATRERYYMAVSLVDLVKDAIFGVISQGERAKAHIAAIAAIEQEQKDSERQRRRR